MTVIIYFMNSIHNTELCYKLTLWYKCTGYEDKYFLTGLPKKSRYFYVPDRTVK